jgi:hypothetical protein
MLVVHDGASPFNPREYGSLAPSHFHSHLVRFMGIDCAALTVSQYHV